jgi:uncharacterized Ntn-hydrolase superfamily protein
VAAPWWTSSVSGEGSCNPHLQAVLKLLRAGYPPDQVRDMLARMDEGREARQFHLLAADGRSAAFTGGECVEWCGQMPGEGVSLAGNMLAGPEVLEATLESYRSHLQTPFVERLLGAMEAGEAAGGDKRGKQSAVLLIQGAEPYPRLSLRSDDHLDPLAELRGSASFPSAAPFPPRNGLTG